MSALRTPRIIGTAMTALGRHHTSSVELMSQALRSALSNCGLSMDDLEGLVAVPSLSHPHFMEAHNLATYTKLLPRKGVLVRTVDTGGASPISALISASQFIRTGYVDVVAVVAGDAVASMPLDTFLQRADVSCQSPDDPLPSPVIPNGYDRVARWAIAQGHVTREQLAMCSVLMSANAARHPLAMTRRAYSLDEVLQAPHVAPVTTTLECARRADGAAAIVLASSTFLQQRDWRGPSAVVLGGGEGSGPLYPPADIHDAMFSCEEAARVAYESAQLGPRDVDFFGLYDCFPICLTRALEAVGLAPKGRGGAFVEQWYRDHLAGAAGPGRYPINTHGGLLAFGAPWEVPAMYNIVEAVAQLTGAAGGRQVAGCRRALVYGNGGIFSHSAVALLGSGQYGGVRGTQ